MEISEKKMSRVAPGTMDLLFLGTGSMCPSSSRNVSGLALRFDKPAGSAVWLFDCGEGTQHQVFKSDIKPGKIERIYISHMHGDHLYGLPGLMCSLSMTASEEKPVMQLYGPKGLRLFLRNAFKYSYGMLGYNYIVHELHETIEVEMEQESSELHPNEVAGSNIGVIEDEGSHYWHLPGEGDMLQIKAVAVKHTVPTLSFILTECDYPGKMQPEMVVPRLEANREALKSQGIKNPLQLLAKIKNGETVVLPDGTVLAPESILGPKRTGRKICIMGDTCDSSTAANLCQNSTVVVHEATNAKVTGMDDDKTLEEITQVACEHGHSTPQMAGAFARDVRSRWLILTHFSQRYCGDLSEESVKIMEEIRDQAAAQFGPKERVITARDFLLFPVPLE